MTKTQMSEFLFLTVFVALATVVAYPLVPIAVLLANSEGRLPYLLQWLETPDALGWGAGTYEPTIKAAYDKHGKRWALMRWLWRNSAYRLRFSLGMNVENYDYSQVTFNSFGDYRPAKWGPSCWQATAVYKGKTYFDYRPAFGFGTFYVYLLVGWKLKPYISGYFPKVPNAAGMFSGVTPRTDKLDD